MVRWQRVAVALFGVWSLALEADAQSPASAPQRPGAGLQVYLITVGEGAEVWEKFGHNALWFVDAGAGVDELYNWGVFDFRSPDFVWRFVTGDTKYWVEMFPGGRTWIDFFVRADRSVDWQRLNLTDAQARKALAFARNNAAEANKYYRYDYFRDNCSTRVRDLVNLATDGALEKATSAVMTPRSYRSESVRLTDDMGFAQFGIAAALGRPADRPISLWEDAFIPMRLRDMVRDVRVTVNGQPQPLVVEEKVAYTTRANVERADVPAIWLVPLIIGLLVAVDLGAVGVMGERSRGLDIAFRAEAAAWSFVTGLVGAVVLFAWLFTRHVFWAANENLLLLNPLSLWLAALAILSLRNPRWLRPAAITSVLVALCSAVALMLHGIPGAGQANAGVLALTVPAHFAVALGLWRRTMTRETPTR